jgi:predicted nuclease of predicted toxin-antitoxin system
VTLLLDENLSPQLVRLLAETYPEVRHVSDVGLERAPDSDVWAYARTHGLTIVSKDSDFHQRSLTERQPPRVIWIRRGNCSTATIAEILRTAKDSIVVFHGDKTATLLILD